MSYIDDLSDRDLGRVMTDYELGWVVGIIEGEAWIGPGKHRNGHVTVQMTDREVVERLREITGLGHVKGPVVRIRYNPNAKDQWGWFVLRRAEVLQLFRLIGLLLSPRRRAQMDAALANMHRPLRRPVPMVHGTQSGYSKHKRAKDPPCAPCREAHNERQRRYRAARAT